MALANIYGYSYCYAENGKKKWFIHEEEAETIRLIYKLFDKKGSSCNSIMKYLNLANIKTKLAKSGGENRLGIS
jgi:hypothetical protein